MSAWVVKFRHKQTIRLEMIAPCKFAQEAWIVIERTYGKRIVKINAAPAGKDKSLDAQWKEFSNKVKL